MRMSVWVVVLDGHPIMAMSTSYHELEIEHLTYGQNGCVFRNK